MFGRIVVGVFCYIFDGLFVGREDGCDRPSVCSLFSKPSAGCTDKLKGLEIWKTHVKMSERASSIRFLFITNMPLPRKLLLLCRIGRDMVPRDR